MASLSLGMAELLGAILQSLLYGVYLVLFVGCLYISIAGKQRQKRPLNKFLFTVTIVLFILTTTHWILQILRVLDAFIYHVDGTPDKYYGFGANPKFVAITALYVSQTFLTDCTMIYRLYIVWGRNWKVIILPSILTTALVGAGSGVVYSFSRLNRGQDIFNSSAGHLVITVFVTTLTTNLSVASLISYRIWSIRRSTASTGLQTLTPIIHVILDSAFIYTFFLILTHAGYLAKDTYQFISLDMTSPAIGIAFSLIIVRVGLSLNAPERSAPWQSEVDFNRPAAMSVQEPIPLGALAINISKRVDMHRDMDSRRYEDVGTFDTHGDSKRIEWHDAV